MMKRKKEMIYNFERKIQMTLVHPDFPHITIDTEVCFGKPCIKGTRMPVSSVLDYLSGGMSIDEFTKEFHWITRDEVLESLAFSSQMMQDRFVPIHKAS